VDGRVLEPARKAIFDAQAAIWRYTGRVMIKTARRKSVETGSLLLLAFGLVVTCNSGCGTARTPRQAVLGAFNVYDADVRRRSVNELAAAPFGGEQKYVRTYRLLIDDPDPTVRAACAHALGLHGDVEDAERLIIRLDDVGVMVRWEAAKALQKIHNPSAAKPLIVAMRRTDEDADVRKAAAVALGQYAEPRVFDALVGALEDVNHSVVVAARRSLKTLTGYDFGSDGAMWLAWAALPETNLFERQETYTWQPYQGPAGIVDKVKFWNKTPEQSLPRVPTGLEDDSS